MRMDSTRIIPKVSEVVVALFTDLKNAKDAVSDLSRAGFDSSQINVAYASPANEQADVSSAEHSVFWKLRDSFRRDLHIQGAEQVSGETENGNVHAASPYTEVDLQTALSEIGVAPDRISLLENEIGAGVLLLVKAAAYSEKAEEILERNEGTIRTETALESAAKVSA
jgi:hypothetical protein